MEWYEEVINHIDDYLHEWAREMGIDSADDPGWLKIAKFLRDGADEIEKNIKKEPESKRNTPEGTGLKIVK